MSQKCLMTESVISWCSDFQHSAYFITSLWGKIHAIAHSAYPSTQNYGTKDKLKWTEHK